MKLTRNEVNALATAFISDMYPVNANWYRSWFSIPHGRAMALERHRLTKADIRRIKGALERANNPEPQSSEVTMKCLEELKTRAITRVSDDAAALAVKTGMYRYVPKNRWRADKRKKEATNEAKV